LELSVVKEEIEDDIVVELAETGYQPSFAKLSSARKQENLNVDPKAYLDECLSKAVAANPTISGWIQASKPLH
jgi:hypothetical protein